MKNIFFVLTISITLAMAGPNFQGINNWTGRYDPFKTILQKEENRRKRADDKTVVSWFAQMFNTKNGPEKTSLRPSEKIKYSLFQRFL